MLTIHIQTLFERENEGWGGGGVKAGRERQRVSKRQMQGLNIQT
jgi:hypothetical protein